MVSPNFITFCDHKETCAAISGLLNPSTSSQQSNLVTGNSIMSSRGLDGDRSECEKEVAVCENGVDVKSEWGKQSDDPDSGTFECPVCLILHDSPSELATHIRDVHKSDEDCSSKCSGCQGGFKTESLLSTHRRLCKRAQAGTELHPCDECLISFERKSLLDLHMLIHEASEAHLYNCVGCNAGFIAETHKASHEQDCGKCKLLMEAQILSDQVAKKASNPMNDQTSDDVPVPAKLELPAVVSEDPSLNMHHSFSCKLCSGQFLCFIDCESHLKTCAQTRAGTNESLTNGASSKLQNEVTSSVRCEDLENDGVNVDQYLKTVDLMAPRVLCTICGINMKPSTDTCKSTTKTYVSRHMAGHTQSLKRFACPGCGWGKVNMVNRRAFFNHTKFCCRLADRYPLLEFDETRVHCPVCLVTFRSIGDCEIHVQRRHYSSLRRTEDRFLCSGCKAHYNTTEELASHTAQCCLYNRAMLTPGNGSACGVCAMRYTKVDRFERHFAEYHTILLNCNRCTFCDEKFDELKDVIVHVNIACGIARSINEKEIASVSQTGELKDVIGKCSLTDSVSEDGDASTAPISWSRESCVEEDIINNFTGRIPSASELVGLSMANNKCVICGVAVGGARDKHMLIHTESEGKPYRCQYCKGGFLKSHTLTSHQIACKRINGSDPNRHSAEKCDENSNESVASMCSEEPDDVVPSIPNDESVVAETSMHSTQYTDSCTDIPTSIELEVDCTSGDPALRCTLCEEAIPSGMSFEEHVATHTPAAEYKCKLCEKNFAYEETLQEHKLNCGNVVSQANQQRGSRDDDEVRWW